MWPFKRKHPNIDSLLPPSHDSHRWAVAMAENDGSPLMIRYNESARSWKRHPELPIKIGFAIPLNTPNAGGLPDQAENEQLNEIEEIIIREVELHTPALQAMALTTGIMKEFIFYAPTGADIKSIHESIQAAVSTHEVQCMAVQEPKWDSYTAFAPY